MREDDVPCCRVAPDDLHTSMPRNEPFVYGERRARNIANIMPGKIAVP